GVFAVSVSRAIRHRDRTVGLASVIGQSENDHDAHFVCKPLMRLVNVVSALRLEAFASSTASLARLADAEVLRQHAECSNENALRALLPHRASSPALSQRPLAHGRLHSYHVPDARTR